MPEKFQEWIRRIRMVPESTLYLACGLCALGGVMLAPDIPARLAAAVAAVPLLAFWSMLRAQTREVIELQGQLSTSKEEVFTRRSTMRFIFDELLPDSENLSPQVRRTQQQMEKSLAAAGGIAELLGQSLQDPPQSVRRVYLKELGQTLQKCTTLNRQMVKRSSGAAPRAAGGKGAARVGGTVSG